MMSRKGKFNVIYKALTSFSFSFSSSSKIIPSHNHSVRLSAINHIVRSFTSTIFCSQQVGGCSLDLPNSAPPATFSGSLIPSKGLDGEVALPSIGGTVAFPSIDGTATFPSKGLDDEKMYNIAEIFSSTGRDYLVQNNGEQVKVARLVGKTVGLYFVDLAKTFFSKDFCRHGFAPILICLCMASTLWTHTLSCFLRKILRLYL